MPITLSEASAATTASVPGSMAAPGAALQAARAMSVLFLSQCHFDHEASLSFPLSAWPGFSIGDGAGRYYRGAVVANIATLLGIACLGLLASVGLGRGDVIKGAKKLVTLAFS